MPSAFFEAVHTQKAASKPIGDGKFGAQLLTFTGGEQGVLKTMPFANDSFRGVAKSDLPRREVAAYALDNEVLDFGVVPETVLMRWQGRDASVQRYIKSGLVPRDIVPKLFDKGQSDWKYRVAKLFVKSNVEDLTKIVLLDLVMNNVDRHGKNVLIDPTQRRCWAIDNGLSFSRYYRGYRSIFHKYLFYSTFDVPKWALEKLGRVKKEVLLSALAAYLEPELIEDTWLRIQFILDHSDRLAYKRMSGQSGFGVNKFPSYEAWFRRQTQQLNDDVALVYAPQASVDQKSL